MSDVRGSLVDADLSEIVILPEATAAYDFSCQLVRQCENYPSNLDESVSIQTEYPLAIKVKNRHWIFSGWRELHHAAREGRKSIELVRFADLPPATTSFYAWKYVFQDLNSQLKTNTYLAQLHRFMETCPAETLNCLTSAKGRTPLAYAYNLANSNYKSAMRHIRNLERYRNEIARRIQND